MRKIAFSLALVLVLVATVGAREREATENFDLRVAVEGNPLVSFPYDRSIYDDGDRCGYRGAYTFAVEDRRRGERVLWSVALARVASYAMINDKGMDDKTARLYPSGEPYAGPEGELGLCPPADEEYVEYLGPDERPVLTFLVNGRVKEVRDYGGLVLHPDAKLEQVSATEDEVVLLIHYQNLPVVAYYVRTVSSAVTIQSSLPG